MTSNSVRTIARSIRNLHPLFVALFLLILCFVTYSNSFNNGFLMDDYPMLVKNQTISNPDFLRFDLSDRGAGRAYFRPIERVFLFVNHSIFADRPAGYHLVNLAFFYLGCLALYQLLTAVLKERPAAFLTVVLFATHPINGVVIDYKNATYFGVFLLAMTLGILGTVRNLSRPRSVLREILPLFWCAIAILCHEIAVVYPLYLAAILYFGCGRSLKETFTRSLPSMIIVASYILFRFFYFSVQENILQNINMSFFQYTASLTKAVGWYISKLISMQGILLAHNAAALPSEIMLYNAFLMLAIAVAVVYLRITKRTDPGKLAVVWFAIGLLPLMAACFSRPMFGFAVEPHWMLFGSVGFFLFLGITLLRLGETFNAKLWLVLIVLVVSGYILHARNYNYLWGTQERYCRYWLSVAPESSWAHYWLAYDRMEHDDFAEAETHFQRAVSGSMADAASYANLGFIKRTQGRFEEAAADYERSLRLDPKNAQTHFWLGYVQWELNDPAKAEVCFKKALTLDGSLADAVEKVKALPRQ